MQARGPIKKVEIGTKLVPVYRQCSTKKGRVYESFVAHYNTKDGIRRVSRSSLKVVEDELKSLALEIESGDPNSIVLRGSRLREYERALELARSMSCDLDEAIQRLVTYEATSKDARCDIVQALDYYKRHHNTDKHGTKVVDVVAAFLNDRKSQGNSAEDLADLRNRLARFARAFDRPLCEITTDDYLHYIASLTGEARDKRNHRSSIMRLLNWSRAMNYLAKDHPGMPLLLSRVKLPPKRVEIFTREERELLLQGALGHEIPLTLLRCYVPIRAKEAVLVQWQDFDWSRGILSVFADAAKKREPRTVYLVPELLERLAPYRKENGSLYSYKSFYKVGPNLARRAGIKWKRNGWRSSVISNLEGFVRDLGRVSNEAGNSPREIMRSYLKYVSPEDGRAWFGLREGERHPLEPFATSAFQPPPHPNSIRPENIVDLQEVGKQCA